MNKGFYILRILILLSLVNLFLGAILSFATTIKQAKIALGNSKNSDAIKKLEQNETKTLSELDTTTCENKVLSNGFVYSECLESSQKISISFLNEQ